MEKENTFADYQLPPLDLLDEYIPEDNVSGDKIANGRRAVVRMRSVLGDDAFRNSKAELPVAIGRTFEDKVKVFDLAKAPHLLIAGATKQGKTVAINAVVASLLYSKHPSELKFVFIDPKGCEFSPYNRLKDSYLIMPPEPVVNTNEEARKVLRSLCVEMERRRYLLCCTNTRNLRTFKKKTSWSWPYIVTIIDEYVDLTIPAGREEESKNMSREITEYIIRLAQKGRAVGMHVILATQRPSKKVITDSIKANFPVRIAVRTLTRTDSRTIIDSPGVESLVGGNGDMILQTGGEAVRLQSAFISSEEINRLTSYVKLSAVSSTPYYLPEPDFDPEQAKQ